MIKKLFSILSLCGCLLGATSCQYTTKTVSTGRDLAIADSMFTHILDKYNVEKYGLLQETYPANPDNQVTYLAEGAEQKRNQEVSFLWPYSGMLSGGIALYKTTGDKKYLEKAQTLYNYIYSGWDDVLGGGIYWCEQKKTSKNTCSNAPATVLCMKLYNLTKNNAYLEQAKKTYDWTKNSLRDPEDFVYWDNVRLDGSVDKAKYTYNSGQMIQAGVLLYLQSGDKTYLKDAQETARGAYQRFTEVRKAVDGTETRFYTASPWFNVILLRGLTALYEVDHNPEYIRTMADNARYAWDHTRDINGFLDNDWTGIKTKEHKWLLDNACMVELFSEINNIK